jgi:hypothetical protein
MNKFSNLNNIVWLNGKQNHSFQFFKQFDDTHLSLLAQWQPTLSIEEVP